MILLEDDKKPPKTNTQSPQELPKPIEVSPAHESKSDKAKIEKK